MSRWIMAGMLAFCFVMLSQGTFAQQAGQQEEAVRDVMKKYSTGKLDGVRITVYLVPPTGAMVPVEPDRDFKPGDCVKIGIESNFPGYAYVVNRGSSGKSRLIFPDSVESNRIQAFKPYLLPRSYGLCLDANAGFETIQVFVSPTRITFLDQAGRKTDGDLNESQVRSVAALLGSPKSDLAGVQDGEEQSRGPVFDRKKKANIVTRPRPRNGKAAANDLIPFQVNLKNVGAAK